MCCVTDTIGIRVLHSRYHPRVSRTVSACSIGLLYFSFGGSYGSFYSCRVALTAPFIFIAGWLLQLPLVSSMCCRNRHHWHPRAPFLVAVRGYLFWTVSACSIGPLYFSSGGSYCSLHFSLSGSYSSLFNCVRGKDPINTHFNFWAFASFTCCFILLLWHSPQHLIVV